MKILAIETSHDDSSVALYKNGKIENEISASQTEFHKQYGGTVPEHASRLHAINLFKIIKEFKGKYDLSTIDHIAFTALPGLIGSLQMGKLAAQALGFALNKPVHPINHMHAHIFAAGFNHDITYPSIALIVSGGHTQLWRVASPEIIQLVGETTDDAVGEAFDKVARVLGLGFPGGPVIDKLTASYKGELLNFDLRITEGLSFSFSGIKTKVINYIHNQKQKGIEINVAQVAASFQTSVIKNLLTKTQAAIEKFHPASIILGGGVAANSMLRESFATLHELPLIPDRAYTTDNASMIAIMSDYLYGNKE